jgi:hypothetical protein
MSWLPAPAGALTMKFVIYIIGSKVMAKNANIFIFVFCDLLKKKSLFSLRFLSYLLHQLGFRLAKHLKMTF